MIKPINNSLFYSTNKSSRKIAWDSETHFELLSNKKYFNTSDTHSTCFWKGNASYYNLEVSGEINKDAAWYYPEPKSKAENIKNYVAFWKGVEIVK